MEYKGKDLKKLCDICGMNFELLENEAKRLLDAGIYIGYSHEGMCCKLFEDKLDEEYKYRQSTLSQYCKENNISYFTIISRIKRLRKNPEYAKMQNHVLTDIALSQEYTILMTKYVYKGKTLSSYCKKNNINYHKIVRRYVELKALPKFKNFDTDALMEIALSDDYLKLKSSYYYNGVSLKEMAYKYGLNYDSLVTRVRTYQRKDYNEHDAIENAMIDMMSKKDYLRK